MISNLSNIFWTVSRDCKSRHDIDLLDEKSKTWIKSRQVKDKQSNFFFSAFVFPYFSLDFFAWKQKQNIKRTEYSASDQLFSPQNLVINNQKSRSVETFQAPSTTLQTFLIETKGERCNKQDTSTFFTLFPIFKTLL